MKKQEITENSRILMIGFGSIGQRHFRNLQHLGYKNIAIYDLDDKKVDTLGVEVVRELTDATLTQFSVVCICNPSHLHIETALRAAKAGCHLFIEKPLGLSLEHLNELQRVIKKNHLIVMVGCNYRFHPGFQLLKQKISSHEFGKPLLVHVAIGHDLAASRPGVDYRKTYAANPKKGGGVIMDSGSHAIDYLMFLFGKIKKENALYGKISSLEIKSEDHALIQLEFASGVRGSLVLDYFSRPKRHMVEVQCERGMVRWDFANNIVSWFDVTTGQTKQELLYLGVSKDEARNDMYVKEMQYFLDMISRKKESFTDISHAILVTKVLCTLKRK